MWYMDFQKAFDNVTAGDSYKICVGNLGVPMENMRNMLYWETNYTD